ncbi:hypothetical protein HOP60_09960 [Halomonas daqingensis]|uniref:Uncharacterized protein n=1 Tax=Billgrantia desiderata TaxID=52021 RepID=A0ABS9B599_9GAMM|nr:hypothetical protein [Halomonas desiderata]MCE8042478.1 hypothetical protein [Halomonas desiderata]MCE8047053.1 hypothetical protein [Halomonas desiderata]
MEIKPGRTYRAKKPREVWIGFSERVANDRTVLWANGIHVQYDGPAVKPGRRYPTVTVEVFRAWASYDCTDELPEGEYAPWPLTQEAKDRLRRQAEELRS